MGTRSDDDGLQAALLAASLEHLPRVFHSDADFTQALAWAWPGAARHRTSQDRVREETGADPPEEQADTSHHRAHASGQTAFNYGLTAVAPSATTAAASCWCMGCLGTGPTARRAPCPLVAVCTRPIRPTGRRLPTPLAPHRLGTRQ
ncbi:hypothetical protein [Natrinema sp. H-ect4]|uniref:hypothetical protein n=1 Tax=Natrinema sp. H-ect4 TaxID=3242699 RepID=UPI0035A91647